MLSLRLLKRCMSKCGPPQLEYKMITEDCFDNVLKHLEKSFYKDEPLSKAVGLCGGDPVLEKICLKTLGENMSFMAMTERNEIAGVVLNGVEQCGDMFAKKAELEKSGDEKLKAIYGLIHMMNEKADILRKYDIYRLFDVRMLSVDKRFRGKGISKELIKKSEELASFHNFKIMKAEATGVYAQAIFNCNGYFPLEEMNYNQYLDDCGNPILKVDMPHTKLELVVKSLK